MDNAAMFRLSYGLFVLTAREGEKDNGCIVNTVMQQTTTPNRISVTVNKSNYTHDMIARTGLFNANILSTETPFSVFEHFGFQSGREVNKFAACAQEAPRAENGLIYLPRYINAYLAGKVVSALDLGSHTQFLADVTDAKVFSDAPSLTYAYYHANVKPKPQPTAAKGWRCKICGFVYEGDPLPADYVCPICKHGAADFERI